MNFPDFVWSTADIISSSTGYSEKINKYLNLISEELNADNRIIWVPDEEKELSATNSDIDDTEQFISVAITAYNSNSASVSRINGMFVMTLPVTEKNSDYRVCVQLIRNNTYSREEFNFFISTSDLLSRILTEYRPRISANGKVGEQVVSVKGIHKSYTSGTSKTEILHGIDFDVYENELVVIVGASGTGKTSLLNIIGGIDRADNGSVFVGKTDLSKISTESLRRFRRTEVGFVFQSNNLLPNLTALENIKYVAELSTRKSLPAKVLDSVGFSECAGKYPSQMSPCQQQGVAIACALVKKPRFILADEPTENLDIESSKKILGIFENVVENKNGTVILVTHNNEIAQIADKVIKIEQGKVVSVINNTYKMKAADLVW